MAWALVQEATPSYAGGGLSCKSSPQDDPASDGSISVSDLMKGTMPIIHAILDLSPILVRPFQDRPRKVSSDLHVQSWAEGRIDWRNTYI